MERHFSRMGSIHGPEEEKCLLGALFFHSLSSPCVLPSISPIPVPHAPLRTHPPPLPSLTSPLTSPAPCCRHVAFGSGLEGSADLGGGVGRGTGVPSRLRTMFCPGSPAQPLDPWVPRCRIRTHPPAAPTPINLTGSLLLLLPRGQETIEPPGPMYQYFLPSLVQS